MIHLVTGNPGKAAEYKDIFGDALQVNDLDLPEIQSLDPKEIVEYKVRVAYETFHEPVLVEDVSLIFHAIAPLPGPFIKWFLQTLKPTGLITLLDPYTEKGASAVCTIAYFDGKQIEIFEGITHGTVPPVPSGDHGFGWDSIFMPHGYDATYAQLEATTKNGISHRGKAIIKLQEFLKK